MTDLAVDTLATVLRRHRVETVMAMPDSYGWHCLTCQAEGWARSALADAEQAGLTHHAEVALAFLRGALDPDTTATTEGAGRIVALRTALGLPDPAVAADWAADQHEEARQASGALGLYMHAIVDATGSTDLIDEDGEGDWPAVLDRLADLGRRAEAGVVLRDRVEAATPAECWTFRAMDTRCSDFVGVPFGSATFTKDMVCLPCRLHAALKADQ